MSGFDLFGDLARVAAPAGAGTFCTLMADPPWLERGSGQIKRGADRHYPLMKTDAICRLPVSSWMAADAHAYVWVTNNFLPDGLRVMAAWGFRFITLVTWFKGDLSDDWVDMVCTDQQIDEPSREKLIVQADAALQMGIGQYFRGVTESCLFGVRGTIPYRTRPDGKRAQGRTGFHAPRTEHSVKPEAMRRMVELVSPGPYLEMFARREVPGWTVWGNQVADHVAERRVR
jgi:N6-adenosine-specific RNA methylase IME4